LNQSATERPSYPDYGWEKAEPILRDGGVEALIRIASNREEPLSFGRTDALLSAGKRLATTNTDDALRLNQTLLSLSRTASDFEKPNLAHAAAELAMARCDANLFAQALTRTDAPNNMRYRFWQARISGNSLALLDDIRAIDNDEDTRDVRRVLDGYRAIQELGYCDAPKSQIGG